MTERKKEKPLHLDMDFEEALERYSGTDASELPERFKLSRKRKPPGDKTPPGGKEKPKGEKGQNRGRQPRPSDAEEG